MTVKQLINNLSKLPEELPVLVDGYEGGLDDVTGTKITRIDFDANDEWWYGHHELNHESKNQAVYLKTNKRSAAQPTTHNPGCPS